MTIFNIQYLDFSNNGISQNKKTSLPANLSLYAPSILRLHFENPTLRIEVTWGQFRKRGKRNSEQHFSRELPAKAWCSRFDFFRGTSLRHDERKKVGYAFSSLTCWGRLSVVRTIRSSQHPYIKWMEDSFAFRYAFAICHAKFQTTVVKVGLRNWDGVRQQCTFCL